MKTKLERDIQSWLDKVVDVVKATKVWDVTKLTGVVDWEIQINNARKVAELMGIQIVTESRKGSDSEYDHDEDFFMYKGVRFFSTYNYVHRKGGNPNDIC